VIDMFNTHEFVFWEIDLSRPNPFSNHILPYDVSERTCEE
jgi:hypothetical protein